MAKKKVKASKVNRKGMRVARFQKQFQKELALKTAKKTAQPKTATPTQAEHVLGFVGGLIVVIAAIIAIVISLVIKSYNGLIWPIVSFIVGILMIVFTAHTTKRPRVSAILLLLLSLIALISPPNGLIIGPILGIIGAIIVLVKK